MLTGKLYDYLAAGRPILVLVNGPDDPELREIVEGAQAGKVFDRDSQPTEWLLDCYRRWKESGGRLLWSSDREKLKNLLEAEPGSTAGCP